MYLLYAKKHRTLKEIGYLFGEMHHTSVIHGIQQVEYRKLHEIGFRERIEELEERLA
jgi:chromosomal replication initiation ATPase DnaA